LQPAEIKLIRTATTTNRAYCGPSKDERDPSNNPKFSETGNAGRCVAPWGPDREIRAKVIRWLCVNREARSLIDPQGLQLFGAKVTGELDLQHVDIPFPLSIVQSRLVARANLNSCQISRLDLDGSSIRSITINGANIKQSIYLRGLRAQGTVSLVLAHVGDTLTCEESTVCGTDGVAISADGIHVGGDVFFRASSECSGVPRPFRASGSVRLIGAEIRGDVDCDGGKFWNKGGDAITLERSVVHGEIFFSKRFKVKGNIDLTNTSAAAIEDDDECWPIAGNLKLDGFTYTNINPNEVKSRLRWLALDSSDTTQPYRQFAKVLQDAGEVKNAKCVLIAMEKKLSSKDRFRGLKAVIGYGYKPVNAIWLLASLWLLGSFLSWYGYNMELIIPTDKDAYARLKSIHDTPTYYQRFQPLIFSLENTFPLVKLGQVDKWQPDPMPFPRQSGHELSLLARLIGSAKLIRWFFWIQILLGWLLATLFLAAVSGVVQHD
jgi:hypothetical protein